MHIQDHHVADVGGRSIFVRRFTGSHFVVAACSLSMLSGAAFTLFLTLSWLSGYLADFRVSKSCAFYMCILQFIAKILDMVGL